MAALSRLVCLLTYVSLVLANTEKIVFKGPRTINVPSQHPTINDLQLDVLTPAQPSIRTRLRAAFPSEASARGPSTWFLLDDLKPGQRYEVRVCWAATQPTAFHLKAIPVPLVWDTPELITSLWDYSTSRLQEAGDAEQKTQPKEKKADREASVLFLQVSAAADYYTTDAKLMENVPPVDVDVILDPYILNILPQSMVPTICYVIVISTIAWLVAQQIAGWLRRVALSGADKEKKTQ